MKNFIMGLCVVTFTATLNASDNRVSYNIDDQTSVRTSFRTDLNTGNWRECPLEILETIASTLNISKNIYGLSHGFRALHLSGILDLNIKLYQDYNRRIPQEQVDLFRNISSLVIEERKPIAIPNASHGPLGSMRGGTCFL